jgi:pyruvate/2-oxoglutarate dehydrogenase complex dihydrolipoamide dehydrogenase (E3) component
MTKTETRRPDLCIIGAGSGGLSLAAGAAQLGMDVVLIEKGAMGGDCLNSGCVPSKAVIAAGKTAQNFRDAAPFGILKKAPAIDFQKVHNHVHDIIAKIAPHDSVERFEGLGVEVIQDRALFLDNKTLRAGQYEIKARYFVIATGSHAFVPDIPGLKADSFYTNENIFSLTEKPEHLLVIGGGPIGVEMAQAYKRLGSKVTIIQRDEILPHDECTLVNIIRDKLKKESIEIFENATIEKVTYNKNAKPGVQFLDDQKTQQTITPSHILIATGRVPAIQELGLENTDIKSDQNGIIVDQRLRSNIPYIFAMGDVAGGPKFTHIAGYHAGIIIQNICFRIPARVTYRALPWVTYTDPELAHAGMTEAQAVEEYGREKIEVKSFDLNQIDRAQADRKTEGGIVVIAHKNGRILGTSIAAPHAGEMILTWCLAINKKLKVKDIAQLIVPYPTYGDLSKRVASSYFTTKLFSETTKRLVKWLQKLPQW